MDEDESSEKTKIATIEGRIRERRMRNVLGFRDEDFSAKYGLRTDAEWEVWEAAEEASKRINPNSYDDGDLVVEVVVWSDGEIESFYPQQSD